jgi:hypothetical protein
MFSKRDEKPAQPNAPVANIPVEQVLNLRGQGISNNQIVEMLQRDGYKTHQIFDAMNQADLRGSAPQNGPGADMRAQVPEFGNPQDGRGRQFSQNMPQMPPQMPQSPVPDFSPEELEHQALREEPKSYSQNYSPDVSERQQAQGSSLNSQEVEKIEEIAEAIIDEKWNEFIINVNKIVAWKERTESRMSAIEKRFEDVKGSVDELQKTMLGRIGEYDRHVTDVGTEIKAMEKVFQKVLPSFTSNVNELSRITSDLKEKRRGD